MIFGIRVCASVQQGARDGDQACRALGRIVIQAGVAYIQQRLPILDASWLSRYFRVLLQPRFDRASVAQHEFGMQVRMREPSRLRLRSE
jgi:hypothetical protein